LVAWPSLCLPPGKLILLGDGTVKVEVLRPLGPRELVARVLNTQTLGEATLIEFVGVRLTLPFLSPSDVEWLAFCGQQQGRWCSSHTLELKEL
jgi:pyruvate kinase